MRKGESPYHRLRERTLMVLAGIGIVLTTHLMFFYGDTEVVDPVCTGTDSCASVIAQDPGFLGLSSASAGLLFYLLVAALTLVVAMDPGGMRRRMKTVRQLLIIGGWAFSIFLTLFQTFGIQGFCMLCFGSFIIVTAMFLVPFVLPGRAYPVQVSAEKVFSGVVGALVAFAILADYALFQSQKPDETQLSEVTQQPYNPALCRYDDAVPRFENLDQLAGAEDPFTGPVSAPVTILEFIDPNCPACKRQHPIMQQIAAKYPNEVRIVYKLVTLVGGPQFSLDEVMALWLANEQGRFSEMIAGVFDAQNPQGLSVNDLVSIADDVGLDTGAFRRGLTSRRLEPRARQIYRVFGGMGLDAVPTVLINGQKVSTYDRSFSCLSHLIDQELAQ